MAKIVLFIFLTIGIFADTDFLEKDCLSCHKIQQIPSDLIYRRYLMRYSTENNMQKAIIEYLKHPQKSTSIMPAQFFLKFPMKEAINLEDKRLRIDIQAYLEKFNIKKRIILEE